MRIGRNAAAWIAPGIRMPELARDPVRRDRSDGIDVLRAIFALWVVLAHLVAWAVLVQGPGSVPAWLAAGMLFLQNLLQPQGELHPAVLGFIVLSGYCIHRTGLRMPASGVLTAYAIRRFFRIAPLYYIGIAAGFAGLAIAGHRSSSLAASLSGTEATSIACTVVKAFAIAAFVPSLYRCTFLGNAPLATVMVEIVLYVVYAVAFVACVWRGYGKAVWLVCSGLFLISLALFFWGVSPDFYDWWQNGSVFGFLPYWWLGTLFVNPSFARAVIARLWAILAGWVAVSVVLTFSALPSALVLAELRKLLFALAVGALVHAADRARLTQLGVFALVGRAGYGIYALHAPLTYTLVIYGLPWWMVAAANVAIGVLIHLLVERPVTEFGRSLRSRLADHAVSARI